MHNVLTGSDIKDKWMHRLQPQRLGNGAPFCLWDTCSSSELGSFLLSHSTKLSMSRFDPLCQCE